nr:thymidylate synthase [uncultured bacterium]
MHCFIIAALSADGFLAEKSNQNSTGWTSAEDTQFFKERTKQAGVVVMGRTTYETVGKPLPGRLNIIYSRQTPGSGLPENLRYTQLAPQELLEQLQAEGHSEVAICGGSSIYTQFMKAGVVDTLYLTIEPILFGQGINLFTEPLGGKKLTLRKVSNLSSQTVLLEFSTSSQV